MTELADAVLPLIRTRADLHRWAASNAHGRQMQDAVDLLEQAAGTEDPAGLYAVTHKALTSAVKVVARADDSSGMATRAAVSSPCTPCTRRRPASPRAGSWTG